MSLSPEAEEILKRLQPKRRGAGKAAAAEAPSQSPTQAAQSKPKTSTPKADS